jgi:octopine/nopaline transport system permease protein
MLRFDLLIFGDTGWGDELILSCLMTILVSLSAMGLGILIAVFITWAKISRNIFLKILANFYTTIIRGIPELLVIYLIFFGGSASIMYVAKIFGYYGYIELNAFTMGTISIGLISAAYSTEVFRGAYSIVNKGQAEAAKSLGLSKFNTFLKVLAPQILKHALPGLGNVWQITLKDTALISVTGLVEIMRQSRIASNVSHSPLTFFLSAALLYLILTTFSSKIFNKLENYSNRNSVTIL